MLQLIENYLASKQNSWSETTKLKEGYRLRKVSSLIDGNPDVLWNGIQPLAPYTRVTTWTRVAAFYSHAFPGKENPYETWRKTNQNYFKNTYDKKQVPFTYEEAIEKIQQIKEEGSRQLALTIIKSGTRWCESQQPYGRGYLVGKGGKRRPDFRPPCSSLRPNSTASTGDETSVHDGPGQLISYAHFWAQLRAVGIKPHELRKLAASKASRNGAKPEDLCEIFGWQSFETARRYLQPLETDDLRKLLE